jgi:hypothetical protein
MADSSGEQARGLSTSDHVAIGLTCLSGVMAIVLFFVEKTPFWTATLLTLMFAMLIHPVFRLSKSKATRTCLLTVAVFLTAGFGWHVWPKAKPSEVGTNAQNGSGVPSQQDQLQQKATAPTKGAQNVSRPKADKPAHPKPTAAPSVSTSGSNSPAVGGINQGPGSIAQVGGSGNQAMVNNLTTRPDPVFHWDQEVFSVSESENRPGVNLKIWTDGPMDMAGFLAYCDHPCGSVSVGLTPGIQQPRYFKDAGHNIEGFGFIVPTTITRDQSVTWKIRSKDAKPIKVLNVERFPYDRWPPNNGKSFVPE